MQPFKEIEERFISLITDKQNLSKYINYIINIFLFYKIPENIIEEYYYSNYDERRLSINKLIDLQIFSSKFLKDFIIPKLLLEFNNTKDNNTKNKILNKLVNIPLTQGIYDFDTIIQLVDYSIKLSSSSSSSFKEEDNEIYLFPFLLFSNIIKKIKLPDNIIENPNYRKYMKLEDIIIYQNYYDEQDMLRYFQDKSFKTLSTFSKINMIDDLLVYKLWDPKESTVLEMIKLKESLLKNLHGYVDFYPGKEKLEDVKDLILKKSNSSMKDKFEKISGIIGYIRSFNNTFNEYQNYITAYNKPSYLKESFNDNNVMLDYDSSTNYYYVNSNYSINKYNLITLMDLKDIKNINNDQINYFKIFIPFESINKKILNSKNIILFNKFKLLKKIINPWKV